MCPLLYVCVCISKLPLCVCVCAVSFYAMPRLNALLISYKTQEPLRLLPKIKATQANSRVRLRTVSFALSRSLSVVHSVCVRVCGNNNKMTIKFAARLSHAAYAYCAYVFLALQEHNETSLVPTRCAYTQSTQTNHIQNIFN